MTMIEQYNNGLLYFYLYFCDKGIKRAIFYLVSETVTSGINRISEMVQKISIKTHKKTDAFAPAMYSKGFPEKISSRVRL